MLVYIILTLYLQGAHMNDQQRFGEIRSYVADGDYASAYSMALAISSPDMFQAATSYIRFHVNDQDSSWREKINDDWKQYRGGHRWKILPTGQIEVEGEGIVRSNGEPKTARALFEVYGADLMHAAAYFDLPVHWVAGMIPIEALRIKGSFYFDPVSIRNESGYISEKETPHRRSAGLQQTLLTTARSMNKKHKLFTVSSGAPLKINTRHLTIPHISIMLGAAYMQDRLDKYEEKWGYDAMVLCGAYNAGSLKGSKTSKNRFKILTHGPTRCDRYAKWVNDVYHVIYEEKGAIAN